MFLPTATTNDFLSVIVQVNVRATEYRAATQGILNAGESAVSDLEKLLDHRDPVVRHRAQELLSRIDRMREAGCQRRSQSTEG